MSEIRRSPAKTGFAARTLPNIRAVARREFTFRARTRAFRFTTVLLVVAGIALAMLPTILTFLDRGGSSSGDRIEVIVGDSTPNLDVVLALGSILNSASGAPIPVPETEPAPRYTVVAADDLTAARARVVGGDSAAVLALGRDAPAPGAPAGDPGDLTFELYTEDGPLARRTQLIRQAAISIAIQDRLTRAGVSPIDQARLFTPPAFDVAPADPSDTSAPLDPNEVATSFLVSFGLTIALFMAIILYGQWIAFSVAEEKNSRVMEIVLAAATPFQLLAGKVAGVGALGILQYVIVFVPTTLAILFQPQIAALLLGTGGGSAAPIALPAGLSVGLLATFGVMFVLGFTLYATLYAGVASLVSRQEDVNQVVAPLTFISAGGYIVASYAGTGVLPIDSPVVVGLSFVPLFSPYLMLTRLGLGAVAGWEVALAIALLVVTIPIALWIAARLYRSGVLMYGQRPTARTLLRALRSS